MRISDWSSDVCSSYLTELVVASYRKVFFDMSGAPLLASARAGNVIGGGDWSEDRLIPDLVRAVSSGQPLEIRSPHATRTWQHVLESLRSEERRVGKECVSTCISRGSP